jgi:alanine racemase
LSTGTYGTLTIDLAAVASNYNLFQQNTNTPDCQVAGIVKANAYGLGLPQVSKTLEKQGCKIFFVSCLNEALELRKMTEKPIAVFGSIAANEAAEYYHKGIIPVLNSLDDVAIWYEFCRNTAQSPEAMLHFDTGMSRLGLDHKQTEKILKNEDLLNGILITTILSHFSCADDVDSAITEKQAQRFHQISKFFKRHKKSLCNSSGFFRNPAYHYDLIRPGMAVYGLNPTPEKNNPMKQTVELTCKILQIRDSEKNDTVGYGGTYRIDKKTRIATIGAGYADGLLRHGSNKIKFYYKGTPCPVVGRISMDLITIDIGELPAQKGEDLEILGPNQSPDALADDIGTIGYEILTSLGNRYYRIYKNRPEEIA